MLNKEVQSHRHITESQVIWYSRVLDSLALNSYSIEDLWFPTRWKVCRIHRKGLECRECYRRLYEFSYRDDTTKR